MSDYTPKPDCDRCGAPYHRHNGDFRFCPFISTYRAASAIEAATAGETVKHGSTEGESAVAESETPNNCGDSRHD